MGQFSITVFSRASRVPFSCELFLILLLILINIQVQEALLTVNGIGSDDLYSFNLYKSKLLLLRERIKNLQEVRELYENIENFETYDGERLL
jgi:hypothetical protein